MKGGKAVLRGIMLFFLLVCAILIPTLWVLPRPHDTLHLQIRHIVHCCAYSYVALFYSRMDLRLHHKPQTAWMPYLQWTRSSLA